MEWKLTRDAIGEPAIDQIHPDDDEFPLGNAYLRALVAEDEKAHQLAEGVYYIEKSEPGKWL